MPTRSPRSRPKPSAKVTVDLNVSTKGQQILFQIGAARLRLTRSEAQRLANQLLIAATSTSDMQPLVNVSGEQVA